MEVRVCKECRRLFQYLTGVELCYDCRKVLEDKFQEVQEYISEKGSVSITQVSRECEVPAIQLKAWLDEDRLELVERICMEHVCEKCGQAIYKGNFCSDCKKKFLHQVGNALRKEEQKVSERKHIYEGPRMHFIKR